METNTKIDRNSKGIEIAITAESENESPEGCFASGDDAADKVMIADIRERSERGDEWAWCCVHVRVTYRGVLSADAYLGCCSYDSESDFRSPGGYFDDLVEECIADINAKLAVLEVK